MVGGEGFEADSGDGVSFSGDRFLVDLDEEGAGETDHRFGPGEDLDDVGPRATRNEHGQPAHAQWM
jgi:hypothetical protein